MRKSSRYADELAYFNAIACLLVILIHVLSQGISLAEPTSWQMAAIYFPWRWAAFVVPAFLFSGGVKMSLAFGEQLTVRQYGRYLWSRVGKIYLPYLLWNVLYYLVFLRIGYVSGTINELLRYIWVGNISSPFYYVVIVMQFYLLQPLWFWLVKKVPWHIAALCAVLVTLLAQQGGALLELVGLSFGYMDRVFSSYLIFWVLGLYAGEYYEKIIQSIIENKAGVVLSVGAVLAVSALAYIQYTRKIYTFNLGSSKIFVDCLSILILLWVSCKLARGSSRLKGILRYIHSASFFVYLSHCLFLTLGTAYLQNCGVTKLSVLLLCRFAVCYTLPFLSYEVWRRARKMILK